MPPPLAYHYWCRAFKYFSLPLQFVYATTVRDPHLPVAPRWLCLFWSLGLSSLLAGSSAAATATSVWTPWGISVRLQGCRPLIIDFPEGSKRQTFPNVYASSMVGSPWVDLSQHGWLNYYTHIFIKWMNGRNGKGRSRVVNLWQFYFLFECNHVNQAELGLFSDQDITL